MFWTSCTHNVWARVKELQGLYFAQFQRINQTHDAVTKIFKYID